MFETKLEVKTGISVRMTGLSGNPGIELRIYDKTCIIDDPNAIRLLGNYLLEAGNMLLGVKDGH